MPRSQLGIVATSNCSNLKSQSASEIATKITSKSVAKRVEITADIAMIRNRCEICPFPLSRPMKASTRIPNQDLSRRK